MTKRLNYHFDINKLSQYSRWSIGVILHFLWSHLWRFLPYTIPLLSHFYFRIVDILETGVLVISSELWCNIHTFYKYKPMSRYSIVFWIYSIFILAHSYMRTIPNIFIVNMSLSDLMMAALNCIFNYIFMRDRNW